MRRVLTCALLATLPAACLDPLQFTCEEPLQCQLDGQVGECVPPGYCAYPVAASECESALRYGPTAFGMANECVPLGSASATGDMGETGGDDTSIPCDEGGCPSPSQPCLADGMCVDGMCVYEQLPEGQTCDDGDPCTTASACDPNGECVATQTLDCEPEPGSCAASGSCDPETGTCTYVPKNAGATCDDGNSCTVGDACSATGECVGGEICPSSNPCEAGSCVDGACMYEPLADGESCGDGPADRCCGGTCVDISSDAQHCGQCFFGCAPGRECRGLDEYPDTCLVDPPPAGRCSCLGVTSECTGFVDGSADDSTANDQVCRTVEPGTNVCVPNTNSCTNELGVTAGCPGYCYYP